MGGEIPKDWQESFDEKYNKQDAPDTPGLGGIVTEPDSLSGR